MSKSPKNKKSYKSAEASIKNNWLSDYAHRRTVTTYRYFDIKNKPRAGPHTTSHVFTKINVERLAKNLNIKNYRVFLDTRLAPSPGKTNAILKEGLAKKGRLTSTINERRRYLSHYTKLYNKIQETTAPNEQLKLLAKLIEASPQQTYRWPEGHYTSEQIAGKGESQKSSKKDTAILRKFSSELTYANLTGNGSVSALDRWKKERDFKSIDYDAESQSPDDLRRVIKRSAQLVKAADASSHDWETMSSVSQASDYDLVTKESSGQYSIKKQWGLKKK